ncbi:hypothetical protein ACFYOD_36760 [Streptomyces sp. NPDC006703]|uniref:hypothetical protein n=1 Tax=Streptomyces sp. NPDC006703 TaxID=3364759 RepID=UPI00368BE650
MLYDSERARQPKADPPDRTTRRASQTTGPEPAQAPGDGRTGSANAVRTQVAEHRLLSADEREELAIRLQRAVDNFVDSTHRAVEEADHALADMVTCLTNALAARQQGTLRANWQRQENRVESEELRIALQEYREATVRMLAL